MAGPPPAASPPGDLSAGEKLDRLRLIRSENVGPITYRQLLGRFASATQALAALPDLARRGGRKRPIRVCPRAQAEQEMTATEQAGADYLFLGQPGFPAPLAALDDSPPVLVVKGHPHLLTRHAIAIVGARNASAVGVRFAHDIAARLGESGLVVVSGLARGIDTAAHQGSLKSGTMAVLAGGIDIIYPPENDGLYHDIAAQGVLVAEMPLGTRPQGRHFPRRNRIISGLARGVLVVEAAPRSGSLITARYALEQGREVFAVPGSPLDPRHRGANHLIRQGAVLVENVDDILPVLEPVLRTPLAEPAPAPAAPPPAAPDEAEVARARTMVRDKLDPAPVAVDDLIRQTGLTPAVVLTILLELELAGQAARLPGNRVRLA
jgi:DNA processing protein